MQLPVYTPQVQKTAGGDARVAVPSNIGAAGALAAQGMNALGKGLGDLNAVLVRQAANADRTTATAANNEYTQRLNEVMYNDKDGLMHTQMKGADGIASVFAEKEKQIREEVAKKYKYNFNAGRQEFDAMANRIYGQRMTNVQNHMYQESEKYRTVTFSNAIDNQARYAADNYSSAAMVDDAIAAAIGHVDNYYAGQGEEVIAQQRKKIAGQIAQQVIGRAYANGGMSSAETYIEKYGRYMDPVTLSNFSKGVYQNRLRTLTRDTAESLVGRYGNNLAALHDAIYNRGEGGSGYDGNKAVEWMRQQASNGANWGVNTCTKGVNAALEAGGGLPGNTWAPTNWDDAKKAGMAFKDRRQLRSGDIVYWWKPGSDKDADDTSHVGIYDAETGKVYQSGTSGFKAIALDTYSVTGFARPQGRGMTRDQQDALYDACVRKINQDKAIRNQQIDAAYDDLDKKFMEMHDAKNMNYEDYMAVANQYSDPEMRRKGRAAAEYWWNATVKGVKASQPTMGVAEMDTVTNMIRDGEFDSVSDMVSFMQSPDHPFSPEQINKAKGLWQQKLTGEGIFKYPQLNAFISSAVAGEKDTQVKKDREIVLRQYAINYINSYREKNHQDPSIEDVQLALTKEYTDKKFVYHSSGVRIEYDPMMLTRKGIVSADIAYDAEGKETGMMRVVYADANNRGRSRVTYVPVRQFAEQLGQQQAANPWTGTLGNGNNEPDALNSGT